MALLVPALRELRPGDVVCGEFVLDALVERSRFGVVYSARSEARGRERFAVWLPHATRTGSASAFRKQMERVALVQHRAVAAVVGFAVESAGPMLVTRAMTSGTTLSDALAEGALARAEVGWLVCEVAAALEAFHTLRPPVVHRALHPSQIALTRGGGAVQVDACGLVHAMTAGGWCSDNAEEYTEPGYLSPDVLLDRVDPRMDTFVLASIAFECLTGARAFAGESDHTAVLKGPYPRASGLCPDLAPEVDETLLRAWSPSRERAYETTSAFAMDLARALMVDAPIRSAALPPMKPGTSGVRLAPTETTAQPIDPHAEAATREVDQAFDALWASNDPPGTRDTFDWSETPSTPRGPTAVAVPSRAPLGSVPSRPTTRTTLPAPSERPAPAERPEPSTLAPPAYPAWAGRVSRPNARVDAFPPQIPPIGAPPPLPFGPPVRPTPEPVSAAISPDAPPASTPSPPPAPAPLPSVPPRRILRRSMRAPRVETASLEAALPSVASRSAALLGASMVASALILSAAFIYAMRVRASHSAPIAPHVTVVAPLAPPASVVAPPSAPVDPPPALPEAPPTQAAVQPRDDAGPSQGPSTPVAQAPLPAAVVDAGATALRPFEGVSDAFRAQMGARVLPCAGAVRGHHLRFRVRYNAVGQPQLVAVRGAFATPPASECVERAAMDLPLPRESRGVLVVEYVFRP